MSTGIYFNFFVVGIFMLIYKKIHNPQISIIKYPDAKIEMSFPFFGFGNIPCQ